jgi:hypothetical protein
MLRPIANKRGVGTSLLLQGIYPTNLVNVDAVGKYSPTLCLITIAGGLIGSESKSVSGSVKAGNRSKDPELSQSLNKSGILFRWFFKNLFLAVILCIYFFSISFIEGKCLSFSTTPAASPCSAAPS